MPRALIAALPALVLSLALQPPAGSQSVRSRAFRLPAIAVGMGQALHMSQFLKDYPACRTSILAYFKMDEGDASWVTSSISVQSDTQERAGRPFWPQIALETKDLSLSEFRSELLRSGSRVDSNVRAVAREIAKYRDRGKWFFIRPFSEMNDATEDAPLGVR